jgi:hypothetical protein
MLMTLTNMQNYRTQHYSKTRDNDTQHNIKKSCTKCRYSVLHYVKWYVVRLIVIMQRVIGLSVTLNVIMAICGVIMMSIVIIMRSIILLTVMLNAIMVSIIVMSIVITRSVIVLCITQNDITLSVIMMNFF